MSSARSVLRMVAVAAALAVVAAGTARADWARGRYWADAAIVTPGTTVGNPLGATGWADGSVAVVPSSFSGALTESGDPDALVLAFDWPIEVIGGGIVVQWEMGFQPVDATVYAGVAFGPGQFAFTPIGAIQYQPPPDPTNPPDPFMPPLPWAVRTPGFYQDTFTLPVEPGGSSLVMPLFTALIAFKNTMGISFYVGDLRVDAVCGLTTLGGSASNPLLPTQSASSAGEFVFVESPSGDWFDPPYTSEFTFEIEPGRLFTAITEFPAGFGEAMQVWVDGVLRVDSLGAGDAVDFVALLGHGVSSFVVKGIDPTGEATTVDAALDDAFPLRLAFDAAYADVTMTATPEPASLALLLSGGLFLLRRRRA